MQVYFNIFLSLILIVGLSVDTLHSQSFTDSRDSNSYPYKKVDNLYWFTKSLDYKTSKSWCYDGNESNCSIYGRLYTYNEAKEICPEGWRIPTSDEVIGRDNTGNIWNDNAQELNPTYAGYRKTRDGGQFTGQNERFAIWCSYKGEGILAMNYKGRESFQCDGVDGGFGLSVRCVAESIPSASISSSDSYETKMNKQLKEFLSSSEIVTSSIPRSQAEYDGVYAISNNQYYELVSNKMSCHHFIFPNEGYSKRYRFWGEYPKVCYTRSGNRVALTSHPTKFILKGSHFTDDNINLMSINPVEVIKLAENHLYFHDGNSKWYDEGYAFLPSWDRATESYNKVEFRKKKISENHFEILITGQLSPSQSYMITCKDQIWIFTNSSDLKIVD